MRYEIRQNNGRWKLFDTLRYEDVAAFYNREAAEEALAMMGQQRS